MIYNGIFKRLKMKLIVILLTLFLLSTSQSFAGEVQGIASYYSKAGCLGCSINQIMANGEVLNDSRYTIALTPEIVKKYKLLNGYVGIINLVNKKWVVAKVTDTGGFGKYNRVADLSLAVKKDLSCESLCRVIIVW